MKRILINLLTVLASLYCNNLYANDSLIVVLDENDNTEIPVNEVGAVSIRDKAFRNKNTYDDAIKYLKEKASEVNANLVKITKHKAPDPFTSHHRFEALLYSVDNPRLFEKEIVWSEDRKLEWEDFRAEKKTYAYNAVALTYCTLRANARAQTSLMYNGSKYIVRSVFDPEKSWVSDDSTYRTAAVLSHEQKHFDLCEVYARRLYKELTNANVTAFNMQEVNTIMQRIQTEYEDRQYQYDEETHNSTNGEAQKRWDAMIESELLELAEYTDHD